jgi:hypothetical protein
MSPGRKAATRRRSPKAAPSAILNPESEIGNRKFGGGISLGRDAKWVTRKMAHPEEFPQIVRPHGNLVP